LLWEQEVARSNRVAPTTSLQDALKAAMASRYPISSATSVHDGGLSAYAEATLGLLGLCLDRRLDDWRQRAILAGQLCSRRSYRPGCASGGSG